MKKPAITRFLAFVKVTSPYGGGYGRFSFLSQSCAAHIWAYKFYKGPVKKGMQIDHLCCNRSCVNPAHLEMVTPNINQQRKFKAMKENEDEYGL